MAETRPGQRSSEDKEENRFYQRQQGLAECRGHLWPTSLLNINENVQANLLNINYTAGHAGPWQLPVIRGSGGLFSGASANKASLKKTSA